MNLRAYDWDSMRPADRKGVIMDVAYYLLDKSTRPMTDRDLRAALREFAEPVLRELGHTFSRSQWHRWAAAALNLHAQHIRANNPRALMATRLRALERHERLACKIEKAVDKLLDDETLSREGRKGRPEGFAEDVRSAAQAVSALVKLDALRARIYRWDAVAPDAITQEAHAAETLRMLRTFVAESSPEVRAQVLAMASEQLSDESTSILEDIGLRH